MKKQKIYILFFLLWGDFPSQIQRAQLVHRPIYTQTNTLSDKNKQV